VVATVFWLGRLRPAPGTWGAAAGMPLALATGSLATWAAARLSAWLSPAAGGAVTDGLGEPGAFPGVAILFEALLLAILNLVAVPICTRAARRMGSGKDPGAIVLDEAASLPVGLLVVPFAERTWGVLLAGWLLHRLFDIAKPFPCRRLERLPEGLGIMSDDLAAAAWMAAALAATRAAGLV
jgi:phosphatidylglycerophosphatase A